MLRASESAEGRRKSREERIEENGKINKKDGAGMHSCIPASFYGRVKIKQRMKTMELYLFQYIWSLGKLICKMNSAYGRDLLINTFRHRPDWRWHLH